MLLLLACALPALDSADPTSGAPRGAESFVFPLLERELFLQTVGVDHDPVEHSGAEQLTCTNYDGRHFPWCYDEHQGSDYLMEGSWQQMDAGSAQVVAAAPGVVTRVEDGNYDRCHGTLNGNDCDGHEMRANRVDIEHASGTQSQYLHLMSDSIVVEVGQQVACGELLGLVGSSGNSSQPHLHFEVLDPQGGVVDPYAGAQSQEQTWWLDQGSAEGLPGGDCPA